MFKPPDWKDESVYPRAGQDSNGCYAWEFLRRNAGYQRAWADYIRTLREAAGSDAVAVRLIDYLEADPVKRRSMAVPDYPTFELWWNDAWDRLHSLPCAWVWQDRDDGSRGGVPLECAGAAPWGLERLVSPAQPYSRSVCFEARKSLLELRGAPCIPEFEGMSAKEVWTALGRSRWLILQIDLELPHEVTEEMVLRRIRGARRSRMAQGYIAALTARARPREWTRYLRILDARAQGVSIARIGEVLFPGESNIPPDYTRDKKVRAAERKAITLRDGGYRALPPLKDSIQRRVKKK